MRLKILFIVVLLAGGGWGAYAYSGRLYLEDNHKRKEVGAWCANPGSKNQYLQIDLGRRRTITAVATQGITKNYLVYKWSPWLKYLIGSSVSKYPVLFTSEQNKMASSFVYVTEVGNCFGKTEATVRDNTKKATTFGNKVSWDTYLFFYLVMNAFRVCSKRFYLQMTSGWQADVP